MKREYKAITNKENWGTRQKKIMFEHCINLIDTTIEIENIYSKYNSMAFNSARIDKIIEDNIDAAKRYGACDTVVPATDTIVESINSRTIESIPVRDYYYQGQTPQSFNIKKLFNLINSLTEEESNVLTDACKIFVLKDEDVYLVDGEVTNIKITYPYDLKLANTILEDIHD